MNETGLKMGAGLLTGNYDNLQYWQSVHTCDDFCALYNTTDCEGVQIFSAQPTAARAGNNREIGKNFRKSPPKHYRNDFDRTDLIWINKILEQSELSKQLSLTYKYRALEVNDIKQSVRAVSNEVMCVLCVQCMNMQCKRNMLCI
jgi:hypothetical protein